MTAIESKEFDYYELTNQDITTPLTKPPVPLGDIPNLLKTQNLPFVKFNDYVFPDKYVVIRTSSVQNFPTHLDGLVSNLLLGSPLSNGALHNWRWLLGLVILDLADVDEQGVIRTKTGTEKQVGLTMDDLVKYSRHHFLQTIIAALFIACSESLDRRDSFEEIQDKQAQIMDHWYNINRVKCSASEYRANDVTYYPVTANMRNWISRINTWRLIIYGSSTDASLDIAGVIRILLRTWILFNGAHPRPSTLVADHAALAMSVGVMPNINQLELIDGVNFLPHDPRSDECAIFGANFWLALAALNTAIAEED